MDKHLAAAKKYAASAILAIDTYAEQAQQATPHTLGQVIAEAGKTQQDVADALGVSLRTITYWAHRDRDPNWRQFLQLCSLAHIDPARVNPQS